ncbi:MAG: molybdopterin-dependent oxidoreductase, partial [Streptosporangiales bacterium]|nr:molybdopterin-dependent oxidoreductase [Streptosporangiales bacterium]
ERLVDLLARRLGTDPAALRMKNLLQPSQFPYTGPTGWEYDSGDYPRALRLALEIADYPGLRKEQAARRERGEYMGIGISFFTEGTGAGPRHLMDIMGLGMADGADLRVHPSGQAVLAVSVQTQGQGHETTFAQIVAHELGLSVDDVEVVHGDTDRTPFGLGTYGSRSTPVSGAAAAVAARRVRERARLVAAAMLEVSSDDLVWEGGAWRVAGDPDTALGIAEIARASHSSLTLPDGVEGHLDASAVYSPPNLTFPFGAYICVTDVDPGTGEVKVRRFIAVDDCGVRINPMIVEGQIHRGLADGIGIALMQLIPFDESGNCLAGSFMDYLLPTSMEVPTPELGQTVTPSPHHPIGAKGVGEAATVGSPAAVVNSVVDALAPFGVEHADMPLTPATVWLATQGRRIRPDLAVRLRLPLIGSRRDAARGLQSGHERREEDGSAGSTPRGLAGPVPERGRPGRGRRGRRRLQADDRRRSRVRRVRRLMRGGPRGELAGPARARGQAQPVGRGPARPGLRAGLPALTAAVEYPASVHELTAALRDGGYLADRGLSTVLHVALRLRRPVLLEGEVGVGKTEVAKALASVFGRTLIRLQCYEGIDTGQALYEWDYARQMLQIRALSSADAPGAAAGDAVEQLFGPRFLLERPLLQAVRAGGDAILLIDEIDRADDEFEAFLLEILSDFQVTIPEIGTVRAASPPVVILTSNRTRELHDALRRRCLYHWIGYPAAEREAEIVAVREPSAERALAAKVVGAVQRLREMDLAKPPGVAETIDWVRTLGVLGETDLTVASAGETLGAVVKDRDDTDLVTGNLTEIVSGG